jgi:N-acetylglutamate synthase-like GNAT family acetyltransferase
MDDCNRHLTTRTGFRLHVRPARPDDDGTVADFFTHVTREDLRFRFLTAVNVVGQSQISALTHVDHQRSENFLAFTEDGSMMIATAMLACDAAMDRGEVAIAIRDDHKHKGISWELLAHIARYAEAKGVRTLESIESRENHAAIELERDMGFMAEPYPGDPTLVLVRRTLERPEIPENAVTAAA